MSRSIQAWAVAALTCLALMGCSGDDEGSAGGARTVTGAPTAQGAVRGFFEALADADHQRASELLSGTVAEACPDAGSKCPWADFKLLGTHTASRWPTGAFVEARVRGTRTAGSNAGQLGRMEFEVVRGEGGWLINSVATD